MHSPQSATHNYAGIAATTLVKTKGNVEVRSYEEAKTFLNKEKERVLASNVTVVRLSRNSIGIRLYSTFILTYYSDGTFEGDDGNGVFATPTTAERCNQFGPRGWHFYRFKKRLYGRGRPMRKGNRYPVVRGEERIWIRLGDGMPYKEFEDIREVAEYIREEGVDSFNGLEYQPYKYALLLPDYQGNNYISLYWGNAGKIDAIRSLSDEEIDRLKEHLKKR